MHTYKLKVQGGTECNIDPIGARHVEISVGDKKATVNVNDLAMIVKECLPFETADELFADVDEREIQGGKIKVKIRANYDIKKGDYIVTSLDINKYLDKQGKPTGIRTTKWGFAY
jgi:hypothetical protein